MFHNNNLFDGAIPEFFDCDYCTERSSLMLCLQELSIHELKYSSDKLLFCSFDCLRDWFKDNGRTT